jgi:glycosyltransferase 2 family protein
MKNAGTSRLLGRRLPTLPAGEAQVDPAERWRHSARVILLLLGLVVFVCLCRRLGLGELAEAVEHASPAGFVVFLAVSTAVFLTYALRWRIVLRAMDEAHEPPPLLTLLSFRAAGHAVSTLLPSAQLGGEPVRALLLRRRGRDWTRAISSVAMDRVLDTSASAVAGPIYVAIFFLAHGSARSTVPWILAVMAVGAAALGAFYVVVYRRGAALSLLVRRGLVTSVEGSLEAIDRRFADFVHTPSFPAGMALSLLAEALILAELWTLSRAFALPISLPTLAGVMVGMGVAQLAPVPAALGSLEATQVGVLTLAGGAASLGLAVGLLVRLREALWILVGLAVLYREGLSWRALESAAPVTIAGKTSAIDPNG